MMGAKIYTGDCLEIMRGMEADCVDAIVTDPPYGIGFMGRAWDHAVPSAEVWREALRVLKPGGHILAFAGTRTQHRMACNIEDAGFQIRDMLAWVYGSGFPKSHNIGKAIDRMDAGEAQHARRLRFTEWVRSRGVTSAQIDAATGTCMGGHYTSGNSQPAIMTRKHLDACRHMLGTVPDWVETEVEKRSVESEKLKSREVLSTQKGTSLRYSPGQTGSWFAKDITITAPATPEAAQWDGWGTALKPCFEPITLARKPFVGTVAANVLQHGTGALNVDGCRVEGEHAAGRWPSNFIHDGSLEVLDVIPPNAARFFYAPKASKADREEGLEGKSKKASGSLNMRTDAHAQKNGNTPSPSSNPHPTVKPTDLMRWLCRLVTPPGGIILDPFCGSGSTGKAAILEGFRFIGCEIDPEYAAIANARIEHATAQRDERLC